MEPKLEKKKINLENAISKGEGNLIELSQQLAELVERLKDAEDRWLELSELEP